MTAITSEVITHRLVPGGNGKNHTPAFKIWNYTFECIVAQMHLATIEYLQQAGTITTGNAEIDRVMAQEKVHARFTIAAMMEMHKEGVPFHLCHPPDSAVIYQILHDHLQDWVHAVNLNPGIREAPIEDLRAMDALAAEIYIHARYFFRDKPFHGKLFDTLAGLRARRGGPGRMAPHERVAAHEAAKKGEVPNQSPVKHNPLTDSLTATLTERNKPWLK